MGQISSPTSLLCVHCGQGYEEASLYECDECGRVYCQDCSPDRDDDAPMNACPDCVEDEE